MKYKVQSANVLNDADKFQAILEYQLFCMEQNTMLFGYNEDVEWTPGTPLYKDPRNVWRDDDLNCSCCDHSGEELEGYYGHHVRPMIQTMEFYEGPEDDGAVTSAMEFMRYYPHVRCEPCGVSWNIMEENNCWNCGAFLPFPRRSGKMMELKGHSFQGESMMRIGEIDEIVFNSEGLSAIGRVYQNAFASMMQAMQPMAEVMRGISTQMAIYDEAFLIPDMTVYSRRDVMINPFHIEPYAYRAFGIIPDVNPFEREEREIELVPEVAPILEPRREMLTRSVTMPADVDLSGRVEPPLPQRPERDFSELADEAAWRRLNPLPTESRRTR